MIRILGLAASLTALVSSGTLAQEIAQGGALDEIVVTARKTEETLQSAPVSVSAISARNIEELGLKSIDDFAKQATGISFSQAFGRSTDRPVIRGQSNILAGVQSGVESGAAYFIDGVYYLGDIQGFDPDSIERVEIIKGPQSALYGRNTYAGAINYITKDPGDVLAGKASILAAQHNEYSTSMSLSGPITDWFGFTAGGRYYTYGGEYTNTLTGKKVGDEETKSGYLSLVAKPGDNLKIRLRTQYQHDDDGPLALFLQGAEYNNCKPGYRSARYRRGSTFIPATKGTTTNDNQYYCGEIKAQPNNIALNTDPVQTSFGVRDGTAFDGVENKSWVSSAVIDWDIAGSGWTLSSLSGYRRNTNWYGTDSDHSASFFSFGPLGATSEPAFANTNRDKVNDFSQELRIASPRDARIRGLVGVYYYRYEFETVDLTFANPRDGEALGAAGSAADFIRDRAVFGMLTASITDQLTVSGEIRHHEEIKRTIDTSYCAGYDELAATFKRTTACLPKGKWSGTDPRITVDYQPDADTLFYGVYATGRKPGGFNGSNGNLVGKPTYEPEKSKGGELGAKLTRMDGRVRLNIAGFYNELTAVQLTSSVVNPTNSSQTLTSIVVNSGDATSKGFELEMQAAPTQNLRLSLGYSYVNAEFTRGCDDGLYTLNSGGLRATFDTSNPTDAQLALCSIKGKKMPLGSPHIINGSANWSEAVGETDLRFFVNTNFSYEAAKYVQIDNLAKTGSALLVGARFGLRAERWTLTAFGRNLLDEDSVVAATRWFDYGYGNTARDIPTGVAAETGAPRGFFGQLRKSRTFGLEASLNF